jgi:hypothetical protein
LIEIHGEGNIPNGTRSASEVIDHGKIVHIHQETRGSIGIDRTTVETVIVPTSVGDQGGKGFRDSCFRTSASDSDIFIGIFGVEGISVWVTIVIEGN